MSVKNQGNKEHEKASQDPKKKQSTNLSTPDDNPKKSQAKGAKIENTKSETRNPPKGKGGKNDSRL